MPRGRARSKNRRKPVRSQAATADRRDDVAAAQRRAARFRRERALGRVVLTLAAVVGVLNLVMEFDASLRLLPGGHSELYFLVAVAAMGAGTWFGFDLGLRERRR